MENDTNKRLLKVESIGVIVEGDYKFTIPSYQRGYRWGEREVEQLLNDVFCHANEKLESYYLQPIVVKEKTNKENQETSYEVIDGQQRLTTIYLLYKYFNKADDLCNLPPKYTISYDAREQSGEFLSNYPDCDDLEKDQNMVLEYK